MATITSGSFAQFSVHPMDADVTAPSPDKPDTFGVLADLPPSAAAEAFKFAVSTDSRGLGVATLRLDKEFQGQLARLLRRSSDVYFLAWCWDLSGAPAATYPGAAASPASSLIPIRGGETREFMGSGAVLFPARPVTSGLAARIQIWESARKTREFGATLAAVADTIQQSRLNSVLTLLAGATGVATATLAMVEQAALELAITVGDVLEASSDNYIDFFEGYFPVSLSWTDGTEDHKGRASEISLTRFH
jgi:hypothetical protein